MLAFLRGQIVPWTDGAVLVCQESCGYVVQTRANVAQLIAQGCVWVMEHARDGSPAVLYGFVTDRDLILARKCVDRISGFGPSAALKFISAHGAEKLEAAARDKALFHDLVGKSKIANELFAFVADSTKDDERISRVVAAIRKIGYEVNDSILQAVTADKTASVENMVEHYLEVLRDPFGK